MRLLGRIQACIHLECKLVCTSSQLRRPAASALLDSSYELARSGKTVTVTLWGRAAEEQGAQLEALPHPLVSLSQCRVTDYNGAPPAFPSRTAVTSSKGILFSTHTAISLVQRNWCVPNRARCLQPIYTPQGAHLSSPHQAPASASLNGSNSASSVPPPRGGLYGPHKTGGWQLSCMRVQACR